MRLQEQIGLLFRIDALIRRRATGKPEDLAERLNISRPSVFRYLNTLRDYGAPIAYCRQRNSYHYTEEFTLRLEAHA